ncbi:MAG TPA: hypothetical protein VF796_26060, partial [Humisphaera sp.]
VRVLLMLASQETDDGVRAMALRAMAEAARPAAAKMIAAGEVATAGRLLAAVAGQSPASARDHAAFLLLRGDLDRAVAELTAAAGQRLGAGGFVDTPAATQLRLACLRRAAGDPARAAEAADAAGESALADLYLADAGRWGELAGRANRRGIADVSIEDLGYACAYHRLAGFAEAADKLAARIHKYADDNPDDVQNAVEALMLNGYADLALDVLDKRDMAAEGVDFFVARLQFERADALVARAKAKKEAGAGLAMTLAQSIALLSFEGKRKEAADLAMAVARGEHGTVERETWMELVMSAPGVGVPQATVDQWVGQVLGNREQADQAERLLRRARFSDPERGARWIAALRDHRVNMSAPEAVALARRVDRKLLSADDLNALVERTAAQARTLAPQERYARLQAIAETLADYDRLADAEKYAAEALAIFEPQKHAVLGTEVPAAADEPSTAQAAAMKLGDLRAKLKKWPEAAAAYDRALKLSDGADPAATALKGWALAQSGKAEEGRRLMDLAHLMPLGDEAARHTLAEALERNDLTDEVVREFQLINRTGDGKAWAFTDALRRLAGRTARGTPPAENKAKASGRDPAPDANPALAAEMWERAFLSNYSKQIMFVEPSANLTIPALIRRTRAVGVAMASKADPAKSAAAVAAAAEVLALHPGDTDSQIAIVRALDRAGRRADADAVHRKAFERYDAVRKQFPDSPASHNLVAWLCGCDKRDLEVGLTVAKRAVELDPGNAAILDTLSEVHFARKEYDEALKVNARCRELEPWVEHHRKNLERFTAAKNGKPTDGPLEGEED